MGSRADVGPGAFSSLAFDAHSLVISFHDHPL